MTARRGAGHGDRADSRAAHRRAHRAEPALPDVRGGHPHPGAGSDALAGTKAPRPRHPQDHARPAGAGEVRGARRRRRRTSGWASTTWRWSRTTTCCAAGGVAEAYRRVRRGVPGRAGPGRGAHGGRGGGGGGGRRRPSCSATTWRRTSCGEVVAAVGGRAELEATGGLTLARATRVRRHRRGLPVGGRADPLVADPRHRHSDLRAPEAD